MTCIVAIKHDNEIWIGGDSAAFRDDERTSRADEKVFKHGEFLFGYSGSFRVGQLVRYAFNPPKNNKQKSDMEYMVVDFVDSLRFLLEEKGKLLKDESGDSYDSEIVVGFRNKIYVIESDFNVSTSTEKYVVSGSGSAYALGALYVLDENDNIKPKDKVEIALKASAQYCPSVKAPFTIMSNS